MSTYTYYHTCSVCSGPVVRIVQSNLLLTIAFLPLLGPLAGSAAAKRGDGVCLDCGAVFGKRDAVYLPNRVMPKDFNIASYVSNRKK